MAYLAEVASAPIHESEVGDMQVESTDALREPGTKEGQLKVVGKEAYQWSMAEERWIKVRASRVCVAVRREPGGGGGRWWE